MKPLAIFKGKSNGRIAKIELSIYLKDGYCTCQENAWCDKAQMLVWIAGPLTKWKMTLYSSIVPIFVLQAFKVHMMAEVINAIENLGIDVVLILGGCM